MKKLFSIFCCLLLSASMVTQAQVNSTSHEVNVKGTVKVTRHNAPQAVQAWNWTGDLEASDIDSWSVSDWTDKLYLEVVTNCCGIFGFEFKTTDRDYDVDGNLIIPAGVYIMADNGSAVEGNAINGYTTDEINGCFQFTDGNNWWIFDSGKVTVTKPDGRMSVNLYAYDDGNYQNNFNVYPPDNTIRQNQTINLSITNSNFTQSGNQFIFDATSSDGYRVRIRVRSSVIAGTYPTSKIRFFGNNTKETFVTLPNSTIKEMDMGQAQVTQTDGRYSIDAYITSTDRIEYHIVGTPISYSVSVASNDASLGTVNSAGGSYLFGANSGTFTASATTGIFDGWYLDGNKVNSSTSNYTLSNGGLSIQLLNLQSNHTLEARFNVSGGSYAVNYGVSPVGAGSITGATYGDAPGTSFDSGDVLAGGSSITLTAGNNSGYRFDKWSNNATANPYTFLLSKDTTLTAQFIKTYVITATSSIGGSATGSGTYDVNGVATLIATSNDPHQYFFDHWEVGGSTYPGGATITPTVTADATYTAVFRPANTGTITANVSPAASGSVTVNQPSTAGGTAVTLTPVANDGYTFSGWADGGNDNPRTVYVDGNRTYTAQFVEGIEINVQSFLFRDCTSGGWFNFQGITTGYQFVFFVNNSSVVGNYTQAHLDSDNKIYDHGTELSITTASFSVTADATNYYLDGEFVCSNGKRYFIHTWHEKRFGPYPDDEASSGDYDGTSFSSISSNSLQGDGSYLVKATTGDASGYSYAYQTEIDFIVDAEKQHGSEKIPGGFYFINHSGAAGTVKATNAIGYLDLNNYNDYDDIGGSYVRETYHGSYGYINNLWIWTLNDGYARVTNVNEQYYIYVRARNSFYYTAYYTIGTAPFDVDITGDENGSVDIAYYASNWGTTVHYEEGTNEFFSGNVLNLTATPNSGYEFWRWSDEDASVKTSAYGASRNVTVSGNLTLQAIFRVTGPATITLCEDCDNSDYNTFKTNYNGETVNVTYNRQFAEGRWSTMCLPFSIELPEMITQKMYGRVYEFKYATGNANTNSGVNLYFSNAKKIEAGKCYIVNANAELAAKTSFVFSGVTIDLSKDNGADLSSPATPEASVAAYNALPGYKSEGTIELVGTLRNGILMGTATGNKYMGLKDNKIYYPNTGTGSTIWAYRGIFRSTETLNVEKMRIVVDGEDKGEIRIDNGELIIDNGSPVRKFIRNGNLYIEREGVIYDAQGKRVE